MHAFVLLGHVRRWRIHARCVVTSQTLPTVSEAAAGVIQRNPQDFRWCQRYYGAAAAAASYIDDIGEKLKKMPKGILNRGFGPENAPNVSFSVGGRTKFCAGRGTFRVLLGANGAHHLSAFLSLSLSRCFCPSTYSFIDVFYRQFTIRRTATSSRRQTDSIDLINISRLVSYVDIAKAIFGASFANCQYPVVAAAAAE